MYIQFELQTLLLYATNHTSTNATTTTHTGNNVGPNWPFVIMWHELREMRINSQRSLALIQQSVWMKPESSHDASTCGCKCNVRKLTKTLYEADDTCPTPFSWDFHDPEQKVSIRVYEVGRKSRRCGNGMSQGANGSFHDCIELIPFNRIFLNCVSKNFSVQKLFSLHSCLVLTRSVQPKLKLWSSILEKKTARQNERLVRKMLRIQHFNTFSNAIWLTQEKKLYPVLKSHNRIERAHVKTAWLFKAKQVTEEWDRPFKLIAWFCCE